MNWRSRQQGVALISVLLVFALAAIITSQVASRHFRDIRKTANLINSKQAYHYALAGEQFARQLLYRDFIDNEQPRSDQLSDNWANIEQVFDIENGAMTIDIIDLHSRFNLNNLINSNGQVDTRQLSQFQRLLTELDVDSKLAITLVDWLDSNKTAFKDGAEDEQYAQYQYLTANQPMADRSELRLLNGLNLLDYDKLKDYVVSLPVSVGDTATRPTAYNLNTLDAKIVTALSTGGSNRSAIARRQQQGGYTTVNQWISSGDAAELAPVQDQLTTQSVFFELVIKAVYADRVSVIRSQVHRNQDNGTLTMIKRQQGIE